MRDVLRAARSNLVSHWRLKIALSAVLTVFFCVPYFTLQRVPIFPVRRLAPGAIDDAIGFVPEWVWVYQSVYLLLSAVPWLCDSAHELRRYARGFMVQSAIGFAFFLFLPIEAPRPDVVPDEVMFRLLVSYDKLLNSFPSLHVGLSVYTVLFAARISRGRLPAPLRSGMLLGLSLWAGAIAFSALATKQHYAIDLPAGAVLAWLCHRRVSERTVRLTPDSPVRPDPCLTPDPCNLTPRSIRKESAC